MRERIFELVAFVALPLATWLLTADDLRYFARGANTYAIDAAHLDVGALRAEGRYDLTARIDPKRIVAVPTPDDPGTIGALVFAPEGVDDPFYILTRSGRLIGLTQSLEGLLRLQEPLHFTGRLRPVSAGKLRVGLRRIDLSGALKKLGSADGTGWVLEEGAPPPSWRTVAVPGAVLVLIAALAGRRLRDARRRRSPG
ncbi:MAG: hypothetical protein KC466_15300 [Myxococcales bacterium]|nr:hypothetical protein [Myxococcales bacterium]